MQKARRHMKKNHAPTACRRMVSGSISPSCSECFSPFPHGTGTLPSRYWYTIGLTGVFSLAGWSRRIRAGFLVSRATQDTTTLRAASRTQLSCSTADLSRTFRSRRALRRRGPTTPRAPERARFGLFPGRSPLLGESLLFSFPAGTKMFQFPALASSGPPGCPIRRSADQRPFAPTRGFSQLTTSFFASVSLGIHHAPLLSFFLSHAAGASPARGRAEPRCLACANMSKILRRKNRHVENNGFEPLTPCLQSRCSSQLS